MGSGDLGGVGDIEFWRAEAKRLTVENVVLQTRVADLEGQVGALAEKVSVLARLAFGTSSEKAKRAPGGDGQTGGSCGGDDTADEDTAGRKAKRGRGQRRGSPGAGRRGETHSPGRGGGGQEG